MMSEENTPITHIYNSQIVFPTCHINNLVYLLLYLSLAKFRGQILILKLVIRDPESPTSQHTAGH
jgi:hypothetical protein